MSETKVFEKPQRAPHRSQGSTACVWMEFSAVAELAMGYG